MSPSVSLFIGLRYWRSRKDTQFVSFITFFSVAGIALGVAALIVVSAVMNGLEGRLKTRLLGAVPQVVVSADAPLNKPTLLANQLAQEPHVIGAVPLISTEAMIQSGPELAGAQVLGVDPLLEAPLSAVSRHFRTGSWDTLQGGEYQIFLGSQLANRLGVMVGDKVRVLSATGAVYTPVGRLPSQRNFTVSGVFELGAEVDASLAYIHIDDASKLTRMGKHKVQSIRLYLDDAFAAPLVAADLAAKLDGSYRVDDWRSQYGQLFGAVKMEKNMMAMLLALIIAIAAFNVVSALVMMVTDKTSDIAILKTMGLGPMAVMGVFSVQGMTSTVLGVTIGTLAGLLLAFNLQPLMAALGIWLLPPGQPLPVILNYGQIGLIVAGALLLSYLATLYPAWRASLIKPAEALRYE
ncbi:lipoprotein-releasing ABC transporter permease subunit [Ferrimonas sp. SCSIO 43195]|uniref:lipoprotein-releasing ABC transporter permease subunit n=1 Tax=Ferrimonas sp. SCSIO 43195 TaxID=2822844 RepID=UPI00207502AC|nr:lipoprotein-releasing ABC transporter permease subunit [Ferrimonas sp. SCSIO 43195]USD38767.1 lipoprotein-releasing ABC transporter permease subunit [Ferrimonas sp. SCSIO 43195]